jgi:hypothetical protein
VQWHVEESLHRIKRVREDGIPVHGSTNSCSHSTVTRFGSFATRASREGLPRDRQQPRAFPEVGEIVYEGVPCVDVKDAEPWCHAGGEADLQQNAIQ